MDEDKIPVRKTPTSAPAVPKELLSARPAMTHIRPRSPDKLDEANKAMGPAPTAKPEPTEEERAASQERIDYLREVRGAKPKDGKSGKDGKPKRSKKWLLWLLVIVLLAAAGFGAYKYFAKPAAKQTANPGGTMQPTNKPVVSNDTESTANYKDYDSTNLPVGFKYPSDWTVTDTASKLTITSGTVSLPGASGSQVNGQVIITIRPKQAALDEFKDGNATAVLDSKHLTYTQPAQGQRDSTYLSYLQYAKTTTKGALDAEYITGNAGYQKGQFVPQADVIKTDPLITVTFMSCSGSVCTTTVNVSASSWSTSKTAATVEAILKSLALS